MISFRYHIVSIVAVFLALALGIVVGTTALNGPITKDLRNQVDKVEGQRDDLAAQVKTLKAQVDDAGEFAATYGPQLVANTLKGTPVLLVSLPGTTPGMRDGVSEQIASAGGTISGELAVTKGYLDSARSSEITALATGAVRPVNWTAPETNDATRVGASLLAFVLLGKGGGSDAKQVLSAFAERRLVTIEGGGDVTPSTSVVVLGRGKVKDGSYQANGQRALVDALVSGGGKVVVAGDSQSAVDGGVIATVRDEGAELDGVSTVDDTNTTLGQVSTTLALAAAGKGQFGHYGTGKGADSLFPTPAR